MLLLLSFLYGGFGCSGGDSSIHQKALSGYIFTGIGGQKHNASVQVVWPAGPVHGNPVFNVFDPRLVFIQYLVLFSFKPAWSQTVDRNSLVAPLIGQTHGHLFYSAT